MVRGSGAHWIHREGVLAHEARGSRVLVFVREQRRQGSVTESLMCLGDATYDSHESERPMAGGFSGVAAGAGDPCGVAAWLLYGTPAVVWHTSCCLAERRGWRFEGGLQRQPGFSSCSRIWQWALRVGRST